MILRLGRSALLGLGATAGLGLLALIIYQEVRRRRRSQQEVLEVREVAPPPPLVVSTEHLDAQEAAAQERALEAVEAVVQCLPPDQQRELWAQLDQVLSCVSSLRSEVAELRGGLQDIAMQIIQDVKRGVEDSQRARRRRPLRERSDSMSSSSVYFTASQGPASQGPASQGPASQGPASQGPSSMQGDSSTEGGYSTAYADSDYTDRETDREGGREGEDSEEEEQSCATVLTLRQEESQEEEEEDEVEEEVMKEEQPSGELALLLAQSDVLHTGDKRLQAEGLHLLLEHRTQFGASREFLWRLARSYSDVLVSTQDPEERDAIAQQGREEAESVLRKSDLDAECHVRFAVLAGLTSQTDSMHSKLKGQRILKEHLDRALALSEDLPLAFYLLGRWSYQVATLGWLEKKAAAALYQQPPNASIRDALDSFMKAERLQPGFSKLVRLHIAKCHQELGNESEARTWTSLATTAAPDDDEETSTLETELLALTDQIRSPGNKQ